jgi:hypothetical protein
MKLFMLGGVLVAALGTGIVWLSWPGNNGRDAMIQLAQRGASEAEMQQTVAGTNSYELDADDVIKLKAAGVSSGVVIEMLHKSKASRNTTALASQNK